jgi:hypothetical protein
MSSHLSALPDARVPDLYASAAETGSRSHAPDRLQAATVHDRSLHEHLDRLRCGMVFCDAEGRVHWLNRSAERLLASGPLRLVGSRLLGDSEAVSERLMHKMAEVVAGEVSPVRYLRLGQGELTLYVAIQAGAQPSTMVLTLRSSTGCCTTP